MKVNEEFLAIYTYYSTPWLMTTGDDVRIQKIASRFTENEIKTFVFVLSIKLNKVRYVFKDHVIYLIYPRRVYRLLSRVLKWKSHYDLNLLWKITLYLDELLASIMLTRLVNSIKNKNVTVYVFGSMSLMPWFLKIMKKIGLLNKSSKIIYDPLANYAQTLFHLSRRNAIMLLRYGLYVALHKLSINASNIIVYPSKFDENNAKKMFKLRAKLKETVIVPNSPPICYKSIDEYLRLRSEYRRANIPHFILLAGSRNKNNYEAVKLTIEIFNDLPSEKFKLFITGPWRDLNYLVKNPSIQLLGVVSNNKLKQLIASCDYGLSPVFSHVAGTFLKILSYLAGGLCIIASTQSFVGLDTTLLKNARKIFLIKNVRDYENCIRSIIMSNKTTECDIEYKNIKLCYDMK